MDFKSYTILPFFYKVCYKKIKYRNQLKTNILTDKEFIEKANQNN
jgi:hypothetical protein